jgi:hypothetical protein
MQTSTMLRRLAACAGAAALCAAGAPALAHTTVRSAASEGARADNALRIGHGCEDSSGRDRPVVAQSVVFPTDAPLISTNAPGVVIADLAEVVAGGIGQVAALQDRSIFTVQDAKLDANGNTIGFSGILGRLRVNLRGRVPFEYTAPFFLPDSCAATLRVEIAIADICGVRSPTLHPAKVNLWIPDNGSQFATLGHAQGVHGIGSPARLIVNRDLASNPLPDTCGGGFTVTVTPSPQQVDRDLPIGVFWRIR